MLKHGELVALDSTEHLLHAETGLRVELQLAAPLPSELAQWQISQRDDTVLLKLENYTHLTQVLDTLQARGVAIRHMALPETDLEDVFVRLTQ
ncbi:ABC-type multidrug transport system ATPase subunit [Neisseria perflava]|nr:ABC-type multidrug transport system ATPase subunit [Neisseria perflava]